MGIQRTTIMKTIQEETNELLNNILRELKKLNKIKGHKMSKEDVEYTKNLERVLKAGRDKPAIF